MKDKTAKRIIAKYDSLLSERQLWTTHWDEVAKYVVPKKDNIYGSQVPGEKKGNHLFDTEAIHANEMLAAGLHGTLTSPTSIWFGFSTGDEALDNTDDVMKYTQEVVRIIMHTLNNSNFQEEIHEVYIDLGSFGTAVLRVEEDGETHVRFHARPIYECVIQENEKGEVDLLYYEYKLTAEQALLKFGEKNLPKEVKDRYQAGDLDKFTFIHAIEPNTKLSPKIKGLGKHKFLSFHVLKDVGMTVKKEGFYEDPNVVSRWTKIAGETYGRSPAMKSLPDIKMANKMMKAIIESAQMAVAPPVQIPNSGVLLPVRMTPNGKNFYQAGSKDRIEPISVGSDPRLGDAVLAQVHNRIIQAFFVDQLSIREADRMTATEVMQRRDEQLRTLGPLLGRQNNELLKKIIDRVFNILDRKGLLPDPPESIADRELKVQFTSQIAKAQKASEGESFIKSMQLIAPLAEAQPQILDNLDGDELSRFAAKIYGLPHEILRDTKDVKKLRRDRAEAQQQQMQMAQEEHDANTAKTSAEAENVGQQA